MWPVVCHKLIRNYFSLYPLRYSFGMVKNFILIAVTKHAMSIVFDSYVYKWWHKQVTALYFFRKGRSFGQQW